ncbi:U3 small nucleolar RNA-associated protein 20 [[Candida] jaroonii]|uniref:U3 small nucleolar RNA-associated protein 20 n=1 Tax=[Candida] jaroonii TaxID=467808 RepID=A0ACA9Y9P8_9ASCO|nr:U3 small nucleolar RNA-associated protein 20 [[Candida] jaroonii]
MGKIVKTTKSAKKFTFSSFKERVDTIKIEPTLNLSQKVYDDVESSHFISTVTHWSEVNLSKTFSDFLYEIREISNSLPQIIYHQEKIFESLIKHIEINDSYSIQPLLEVLSQFIHDLGPDFMKFYERTLKTLTKLALEINPNDIQNNNNSSNLLEWIFNGLTFIFKYLSRYLVDDFNATFEILLDILTLNKRNYLSRFCSEALSFLIKKMKSDQLSQVIDYLLIQNREIFINNATYRSSLIIIFSESMKSTKESFHSKSMLVFTHLLSIDINISKFLISGILLEVLLHGNSSSAELFITTVIGSLKSSITTDNLASILEILISLIFAESGRKVKSWDLLVNTLIQILQLLPKIEADSEIIDRLLFCLTILVRNCEVLALNKSIKKIITLLIDFKQGIYFIPFVDSSLEMCQQKIMSINIKSYLQDFIIKHTNDDILKQLSYFLFKRPSFDISIPNTLIEEVSSSINLSSVENDNLLDIHWRLNLIKHSNKKLSFMEFFNRLPLDSLFEADLIGLSLNLSDFTIEYLQFFQENFEFLQKSSIFMDLFSKYLSEIDRLESKDEYFKLISMTSENLSLDDNKLRLSSIGFIINCYNIMDKECPELYSQIRLIEQMPLTINNARDIQLRIRNLAIEFGQMEKEELHCKIISHYYFGLLTNKFQPCWEGVFENIPTLVNTCEGYIWSLTKKFLDHKGDFINYLNNHDPMFVDNDEVEVNLIDTRITDNFRNLETNYYLKYRVLAESILEFAETSGTKLTYSSNVRELTLQTISKIPEIAENKVNYHELVEYVLNSESTNNWTSKERDSLLSIFPKFKSLRSLDSSRELFNKAMDILTSKNLKSQKLALDVVLNYKVGGINRYRDNLKNLLDDTLFKDEITTLITAGNDSLIEDDDVEYVMPVVLRIFFGRVQGSSRSNSKAGKKTAIINSLPILSQDLISQFLLLGSEKIKVQDVKTISSVDVPIKKINGYISLLTEVYTVLGHNFKDSLVTTIEPLIYSISAAQLRIDQFKLDGKDTGVEEDPEEEIKTIESSKEEEIIIKMSKNIRQLGMRCLNDLFKLLGDYYDWELQFDTIYNFIIKPRLVNFADENLQQPSSLLKIITSWIKIPKIGKFLLIDDFSPVRSIISLIENRKAKDSVISLVLSFVIDCLETTVDDDDYFTLLALIIESLFKNLPVIIDSTNDAETINKAITILLLLIKGEYIDNDYTRNTLIESLTNAFSKPPGKIVPSDREKILISLTSLVRDCNLSSEEFLPFYKQFSKGFKVFSEKEIRFQLVQLFNVIGGKYDEFKEIADALAKVNSFVTEHRRLGDFDYEEVLSGYKMINEDLYSHLTTVQWLPIIYAALYFINEEEELVVRSNATYTLNHFVDCYSNLNEEQAAEYVKFMKDLIMPEIRLGIKNSIEVVQTEFISHLAYIVKNSNHFTDLEDMKILLFNNDEEANFFTNINHIQIHRRQRAIRRVAELRNELKSSSISHYILPIIENYAYNADEKLRNVGNEAIVSIGLLIRCVSWNQFKSLIRKYVAKLRVSKPENLKTSVSIVVGVSKALYLSLLARRNTESVDILREFPRDPEQEIDGLIVRDIVPTLQKILNQRNDETIVDRIVISEALVNLIRCISENKIQENLPGLLTSTCQVLRSRSEELRDAARKSLCQIVKDLGPRYFKFLLQELKGALTRGSQIHVLSYTMHAFMMAIQDTLTHGDLDESANIIVGIIMEDIFGAAGQEKEAEGYTSKMKEVKHKKSFDSGELLTSNISLNEFGEIINPIKLILQEKISLKIQNKLDELLRRYALGLNHNEESTSRNILILSFQINKQSVEVFKEEEVVKKGPVKPVHKFKTNPDDHFLVKLNARPLKTQVDFNLYMFTLQKFSFELLRAAISRHEELLTVANMQQFVPLLEQGVNSSHEGLAATSLRLLHTIIKLEFPEEVNNTFKSCARKALSIIKDSPSTTNEVCQASLRFLATLIRHKSEVNLKDTAVSYVLIRIQPDLEEPKTQGLAFNFLKSVVAQHILLPEVYDIMDSVSKIMVVNHNREIRDMARSVYFQFLMEYDQGRGKLEKQFKFLINNLSYETPTGRQSVLELVNLIVNKAGEDLLNRIASSFFLTLANILVNDDSNKCREMSSLIIANLINHLKGSKLDNLIKYTNAWLTQTENDLLLRCGLSIYKIYINEFKFGTNSELDNLALDRLKQVFDQSSKHDDESEAEVEWQLIYSCLNVFTTICGQEKQNIVGEAYESMWKSIMDTLLFPHSWVRLTSSKLVGILLSNLSSCGFELSNLEIQTIAYRLLHQLGAPSITQDLGNQAIKNLVLIAMKWETDSTKFENHAKVDSDEPEEKKYDFAIDFLIHRACSIIRQELRDSLISKQSSIKLCAMVIQIVKQKSLLEKISEEILLSLYGYNEAEGSTNTELNELASECRDMIEEKLGGIIYSSIYTKVQKTVYFRRQERRTKRAQMAVNAPEISARRKMKKHARSRDKRRRDKDADGYYHTKKKKRT